MFAGVTQRTITYKRADGLPLSGTLYLPAGYDAKRDGPLPTLLWAYPAEFTDAKVAGQTVDQGNRFVRPRGISHLFLLTQGYAILDNPAMPIIGEGGAEANDTYVKQLQEDAQAAVDAVVKLGVGDRDPDGGGRAQLRRVHDRQPARAHRPVPRRHRPVGRVQPHADAVRLPGGTAHLLAGDADLYRDEPVHLRRPDQGADPADPRRRRRQSAAPSRSSRNGCTPR